MGPEQRREERRETPLGDPPLASEPQRAAPEPGPRRERRDGTAEVRLARRGIHELRRESEILCRLVEDDAETDERHAARRRHGGNGGALHVDGDRAESARRGLGRGTPDDLLADREGTDLETGTVVRGPGRETVGLGGKRTPRPAVGVERHHACGGDEVRSEERRGGKRRKYR